MKNQYPKSIFLLFIKWRYPRVKQGINLVIFFFMISLSINSQKLKVSPDGHHLVKENGSVFFYMADTGWELFHRLNKEETELYLKDRKAKGFNVIQAVILAELDGLNTPNAEGNIPLIDNNPLKPNEAYLQTC